MHYPRSLILTGLMVALLGLVPVALGGPGIALTVAQMTAQRKAEADRLFDQGVQQFQTRQFAAAIQSWQQALVIYRAIKHRQNEGATLGNLGNLYRALGNYDQAIGMLKQHLAIAQEVKDRPNEGIALGTLGVTYQALGQYDKAVEYQTQSLAIARQLKDRPIEGNALGNLGLTYYNLGNYAQAIAYQEQSLAIKRETQDRLGEGQSLNNLAIVYQSLGNYPKAIAYLEQRLAIAQAIKDRQGEGTARGNLGNAYFSLGNYAKAIEYQQQHLAIARAIRDRPGEGAALGNLGNTYRAMGNYAQAIAYQEQSLAVDRASQNRRGEGQSLGNLGNAYAAIGNYAKAIDYLQQQLAIAREIKDRSGEGIAIGNLGTAYQSLGNYAKAIDYLKQQLTITRAIGDRPSEGNALGNLGNAYYTLGQHDKAITYQEQRLAITRALQDRQGEGQALGNLGVAYNAIGNAAKAINYQEQSLAIARALQDRPGEGTALSNLGVNFFQLGQLTEAEAALRSAITIWESLRTGLTDQNKVSLAETQAKTYRLLQIVLVHQKRTDAALEIAERGRARAFAELLAARLRDKSIAATQTIAKAPNLAEIRHIAKIQNATLVEYSIVASTALYIWVVKPNGEITFHVKQLDAKIPINQLVANSRSAIGIRDQETPVTAPPLAAALNQLHKLLIDPIGADLPPDPNQRVIFLPQGALFLVPFAALPDAQGKYLIERHTISTAPSIQTLALTHAQNQPAPPNSHAVVVGDPTMPIWQNAQLPQLPGARQEAIAIAQILNATPLMGHQATKKAVIQQMTQAAIVHLATHGLLHPVKGDVPGAIALAPNGPDNGLLTASEIFDLRLNADLVVLSACDTGRGDITGDGVIGLSRSLIAAGVPSVVVSLWAVNDLSTSTLMGEFYRQLKTRPNKAQALRQAMLTTLKQYPHPSDWAAFTLIGESDRR
jgi:CHAT domain-containing protein/lipopolysaccharide biosynthesis regulator YciM